MNSSSYKEPVEDSQIIIVQLLLTLQQLIMSTSAETGVTLTKIVLHSNIMLALRAARLSKQTQTLSLSECGIPT